MPITRSWQRDFDQRQIDPTSIVIGQKVRRIDEPHVVLRVRGLDMEGRTDSSAKVLCFNSFGHGKWMPLAELENVS